jgi:hypothetical protein
MRWLQDIPLELREQIYEQLCLDTPVLVHNIAYPQDCKFLNNENRRLASGISLLLTCNAVHAEFESIFWRYTTFTAHFLERRSCFKYCLPGNEKETPVHFFNQQEHQPLRDYFSVGNLQIQFINQRHLKTLECPTPSFMKHTFDRFVISEPLGCHRYPPTRAKQANDLIRLLSFCRGRVREVEFWWHPVRWQPAETAIPWRIMVDTDINFTIRGPTRKGFDSLKKRFSKAIWEYWPSRTWDRKCVGSQRHAGELRPRPRFTFIEDHENTRPDHTELCTIKKQKRYDTVCNCGDPGHWGGTFDLVNTEGT